ncbi:MAG: hypothetical protein U9R29_06700 [Thermodesulfobacteriota bacterium]|nr:hypothetical protein [Thermodesulfobacteriota bacterium]
MRTCHNLGLIFCGLLLTLSGCARPPSPEAMFINQVDALVADMASRNTCVQALAPAAVVSVTVLRGEQGNRLEEYTVERLTMQLRQRREIYPLSRQNWFELREEQPLTFAGQSTEKRSYLNDVTVYRVAASTDEVLRQIQVQITASDARGKTIPGMLAESVFPLEPGSPAAVQYQAKAKSNHIPEGVEERPYQSLDRLSYSLSRELVAAYRANVAGDSNGANSNEVSVVLQSRAVNGALDKKFLNRIESALQQAIVSNKGFTCSVSQRDFVPTFDQVNFYRTNRNEFAMDETLFQPGTVVLLAESAPHADGGKVGVSLRALWRVIPLETNRGELIATNLAGSYLSGFTAKGYLATGEKVQSGSESSVQSGLKNSTGKYTPANQHGFE